MSIGQKILIYSAMLGLRCGMHDLQWDPACGIQFPDKGLNLDLLHWKHGVLATEPAGKSQEILIY